MLLKINGCQTILPSSVYETFINETAYFFLFNPVNFSWNNSRILNLMQQRIFCRETRSEGLVILYTDVLFNRAHSHPIVVWSTIHCQYCCYTSVLYNVQYIYLYSIVYMLERSLQGNDLLACSRGNAAHSAASSHLGAVLRPGRVQKCVRPTVQYICQHSPEYV